MTFSICARESYRDDDGAVHRRYGVAVTTRLPSVGAVCPWASEHGAIATQSRTNVELGRKGLDYLADGLAVEDALPALLHADDDSAHRQVHGVDADGTFAFSGEECLDWYGHVEGENFTVAGNLLVGESVVDATAGAYRETVARSAPEDAADGDSDDPLARRLIRALAAGHAEGGDKRDDLRVQSAAVRVETTEDLAFEPAYNDLRVDATETPLRDLRETFEEAVAGYEAALEKYGDDE